MNQAGAYFAVITNVAGTTNSSNAVLTVYPTAAPALSGLAYDANNQFQLSVTGVPGYRYAILSSTNLADWSPLETNNSPFNFTDTNAGGFPQRFYRGQYSSPGCRQRCACQEARAESGCSYDADLLARRQAVAQRCRQ